jgi:MFS family permease
LDAKGTQRFQAVKQATYSKRLNEAELTTSSLGVTESGLFPGVVYYLSMWYKRNERQYRISLFFSCASLAGAFGGILAWGIAHMRNVGGYAGWRWIFIIVSTADDDEILC